MTVKNKVFLNLIFACFFQYSFFVTLVNSKLPTNDTDSVKDVVEEPLLTSPDLTDPVMNFYVSRSKALINSSNPLKRGISFSYTAKTYYKQIKRGGIVEFIDSSLATYYFNFGKLDSVVTEYSEEVEQPEVIFDFPNIFEDEYIFSFFPNDSGGEDIAIGFEIDSIDHSVPVGIAIIDRNLFFPKWLYMHYPKNEKGEKLSRSYRFVDINGFLFPDSVWDVGTRYTFFSRENYRIESKISDITLY